MSHSVHCIYHLWYLECCSKLKASSESSKTLLFVPFTFIQKAFILWRCNSSHWCICHLQLNVQLSPAIWRSQTQLWVSSYHIQKAVDSAVSALSKQKTLTTFATLISKMCGGNQHFLSHFYYLEALQMWKSVILLCWICSVLEETACKLAIFASPSCGQ